LLFQNFSRLLNFILKMEKLRRAIEVLPPTMAEIFLYYKYSKVDFF
jgi:hypothetical protein